MYEWACKCANTMLEPAVSNRIFSIMLELLNNEGFIEVSYEHINEKEKIDENLKTNNMMVWVQKMNNIQNRARKIVNEEIIYN